MKRSGTAYRRNRIGTQYYYNTVYCNYCSYFGYITVVFKHGRYIKKYSKR